MTSQARMLTARLSLKCKKNVSGSSQFAQMTTQVFSDRLSVEDCRGTGLGFRFGFEFDVAVGEFDGVFDVLALILLADLLSLFLNECGEGVDVA